MKDTNFLTSLRFYLNFRNCLVDERNKSDYELRIRHHLASNWIAKVMANLTADRDKIILIADTYEIATYNANNSNQPLKILDERIIKYADWVTGKYNSNGYLYQLYQKAAVKLRENGLLAQITENWLKINEIRPPPQKAEPKALIFDHVGVAFKISGGLLILAVVSFILERLSIYVKVLIVKTKLALNYLFEFTN